LECVYLVIFHYWVLMKIILLSLYTFIITFSWFVYAQDNIPSLKPDYRNHINIPEYDPSLMPLNKQTTGTGVWTELNPKVPRVDYIGVHFVNKDTGWACGDLGALIKTTDGGNTWTVSQTNTTTPILKVKSFNGQIVIATGYDGLILRSIDGGEIFTQITSGVTGDLWGLEMINDTLGWSCGNFNSLIKTTDAGQSWQRVFTPGYTSDYWWLEFLNKNYGFISGNGYVLRTTDAGINWGIIPAGDAYPLFCLDVIDSLNIAAAGYGGFNYTAKNLYSSDGGNNWINGDTLTTESVNCIQYINPDTGYLVMGEHYYGKTTNRGQVWDYTYNPEMGEFEFQFLLNNNFGYSVGTGLRVSKTQNGYESWKPMIISDNFSDVYFTSANKGFVISSFGNSHPCGLYKTEDGGINWEKVINASDGTTLLFLDSLTGFIGTYQIYKTTDGGINWYIPNGGQGGAGKIFFINETTGWAIRSNIIYKTTDRGENWVTQFTAPSSIGFKGIHLVDSLYGWTANLGGRPYKTTNGGNNWIEQTNLDIWASRDIYITNADTGWIVDNTSWSAFKKTTNGGINWITIPEIINPFEFHFFPGPKHWMISGTPEKYITEDGGITWIDISSDLPSGFNSFNAVTNKLGFAVGGLGLVLRYNDTTYIPVELTYFTSLVIGNDITLNWKTATETNNQGFQIERRETKKERSEKWNTISFVSGNGTTTETHSYSFVDKNLASGKYLYRLKQIDYDGKFKYYNIIEVEVGTPSAFLLSQNYPNPFNPSTSIKYALSNKQFVSLKVFDVLGKEVAILVNEEKNADNYEVEFNASHLASGIYYYKLRTGDFIETKKMILLK
jgi:photosystem II stability/assembly factor-like uncharacterized protein